MRFLFLLVFSLLAACDRQQSFDERYAAQAGHISTAANSIERDMARQLSGAAEAERAAAEVKARTPAPTDSAHP